jgi:hypothetical protein
MAKAVEPPAPPPLSFSPTSEAIAHAHEKGGDISGMLETLKLQLIEARRELATELWLSAPSNPSLGRLKSLYTRLNYFLGAVDLFDST